MTVVFLDANIYDKLRDDEESRAKLAQGVANGHIRVVGTPVLAGEMKVSPFGGFPPYFPVTIEPEAVAVLGHARLGMARLGSGKVYQSHRGESRKVRDAIMADSADKLADIFVSEDVRCRTRLARISTRCQVQTFEQFRAWLIARAS